MFFGSSLSAFSYALRASSNLPCMLVRDREVVPGFRVGRIEFDRALPAVLRFAPQPVLRDLDAELDLFLASERSAAVTPAAENASIEQTITARRNMGSLLTIAATPRSRKRIPHDRQKELQQWAYQANDQAFGGNVQRLPSMPCKTPTGSVRTRSSGDNPGPIMGTGGRAQLRRLRADPLLTFTEDRLRRR